jgi:hypothetical protein
MAHFCRLVNIAAMAIRCMPVDAKHFPISGLDLPAEELSQKKRKDRKFLFFTATTLKKYESGSDFQQIQIRNNR